MLQYLIIPVTLFQQHCTLFWCDESMQAAVVDLGSGLYKVIAAIDEYKLTLAKVFLTHAQFVSYPAVGANR
jgi:hydroxyacylglutathione hydrolase